MLTAIPQCTRVHQGLFKFLVLCKIHVSDEEALYHFQAGLLDEIKIKVLVWEPTYLEAACEIANRAGCIFQYTLGYTGNKFKGKN